MSSDSSCSPEPEARSGAMADASKPKPGNPWVTRGVRFATAPMRLMRGLYDWTIRWAGTAQAPYALFFVAFVESSVFPIPPDALLIPMVLAKRQAWLRIALICTIGSVCGGLVGYGIGWWFYETLGRKIVDAYNLHAAMDAIGDSYHRNAFPTILTAAFTPIPYKVITIGAGLYKVSILTLVVASTVGRAGRFFLVAGLLKLFGERIASFIEKYFDLLALAFAALLIGGFFALRYLR